MTDQENLLRALIQPLPKPFEQAGLILKERRENPGTGTPRVEYLFENPSSGVRLSLSLGILPQGCSLTVFVLRTRKESKDDPRRDFFSLGEFLTHHRRKDEARSTYRAANESCEVYLERKIRLISSLLQADLKPIFLGQVWEDIPMDWSIAGR